MAKKVRAITWAIIMVLSTLAFLGVFLGVSIDIVTVRWPMLLFWVVWEFIVLASQPFDHDEKRRR